MRRRDKTGLEALALCWTLAVASVVPAEAQAPPAAQARGIQGDLRALGFDPGAVDGRWGQQSLHALRRFQRAEGLGETGRADPETLGRLRQRRQPAEARTPGQGSPTAATTAAASPAPAPAQAAEPPGLLTLPLPPPAPEPSVSTLPDAFASGPAARAERPAGTGPTTAASGSPTSAPAVPPAAGLFVPPGLLALWLWRRRARRRASEPPPASAPARMPPARPSTAGRLPVAAVAKRAAMATAPWTPSSAAPHVASKAFTLGDAPPAPDGAPPQSPPVEPMAITVTVDFEPVVPEPREDPAPVARSARPASPASDRASPSPHRTAGDRCWVPRGETATVADFTLPGLVYVGRSLTSAEGYRRNDNCLIDPALAVSKGASDVAGDHMDYWPAYGTMKPSSRRALLEWLAGDRADPETHIGYVFVYLYGLERRAVLDASAEDRPAIRDEVRRLLAIYGRSGSFQHYAEELLAALDILDLDPAREPAPTFFPGGGDLPPAVRIAVGRRIRDGRPLNADWLLAWTMSHPETRVRTPARRALDLLREEFAAEFLARHPSGGLPVSIRKGKNAPARYRAASATFTADLGREAFGLLPDLDRYPEPLALGRELLDACTDRLDAFSRHLGRVGGSAGAPTLQAVALLPPNLRDLALAGKASDDMVWIAARADLGAPVPFGEACARVLGQAAERITPARLRDLADALCRFGIGVVPDPRYPTRLPAGASSIITFPLDAPCEVVAAPTEAYRAGLLAVSVGVLVARADGAVTADERASLQELAANLPGATPAERLRLAADAAWLEANPVELSSLKTRLAEIGPAYRRAIGDAMVRVAAGDGLHHRAEVGLLEKAFRHLGLEPEALYASLHRTGPEPATRAPGTTDELVRVTIAGPDGQTYAIPAVHAAPAAVVPTPASGGVDAGRLAAIRAETDAVSSVLAGVFADPDSEQEADGDRAPSPSPEPEAAVPPGGLDGLDARHGRLLRELASRATWPRADFERLARESGLMPGAAMEELNAWAFDRFDEPLVEDGDPIHLALHLVLETLPEAA